METTGEVEQNRNIGLKSQKQIQDCAHEESHTHRRKRSVPDYRTREIRGHAMGTTDSEENAEYDQHLEEVARKQGLCKWSVLDPQHSETCMQTMKESIQEERKARNKASGATALVQEEEGDWRDWKEDKQNDYGFSDLQTNRPQTRHTPVREGQNGYPESNTIRTRESPTKQRKRIQRKKEKRKREGRAKGGRNQGGQVGNLQRQPWSILNYGTAK